MTSYKELLAQQTELARKVEEARQRELSDAVTRIRAIVDEYNLVPSDIFSSREMNRGTTSPTAGTKVSPKYRNPQTGQTWTGRGKPPKWIEGQDRKQFEI